MRITTEDIRRIIKEELRALLSEKEVVLPEPPQNWQILIYSTKEAMEDSNIKSIINRLEPQPYEEEEDKCRRFESSSDPNPRHIMITPSVQDEIKTLATSKLKAFKQVEKDEFSQYLNKIQKTAIETAKLVWKRIKDYSKDSTQHIYARYNCRDNFGKMMTYIESDKGFLSVK